MSSKSLLRLPLLLLVLAVLTAPMMVGAATITIVPGPGFTDPTPAAPVGGNPGTTIGQQRLFAFQEAANIWGAALDSSVEIFVQAAFVPLQCTPAGTVLGSAGPIQVTANFAGAPVPNTWYPIALANKLAGVDLIPGAQGTNADDIGASFNSSIDTDPNCLPGVGWYYGFDHNQGNDIDFLAVILHELNHGLGFLSLVNLNNGALFGPPFFPDIYTRFMFDNTQGLFWDQMTNAQRATSALNCRNVVWDGPNVNTFAPFFLAPGTPLLTVNTPPAIAGDYEVGAAAFGPPLAAPGITGDLELVNDGVGTTTDGCEPLVGFTAGRIAVIDRGNCAFVQKVQNAEAAGATAVVVADNAPGCPPAGLGGTAATTIPAVRITLDDGNLIKAELALGPVDATLGVDETRLAGADANDRVLLYATDPVAPGSSISHWDTSAFPDLLMEPSITPNLDSSLDLSIAHAADIGWMTLQTCGNNVREGLEICDGSDLFGQTCQTLGFDQGTLACAATCDAFDTSACEICEDGNGSGRWNRPAGQLGSMGGTLLDINGLGVYRIIATLVETSAGKGQMLGVVTNGGATPDFWLTGGWKLSNPPNQGEFEAKIIPFGSNTSAGVVTGRFNDLASFASVGTFQANWEICQ